ncbi:MAG: glycerophosphodiester phosphodiesterase, partial [Turicibacter sp.]
MKPLASTDSNEKMKGDDEMEYNQLGDSHYWIRSLPKKGEIMTLGKLSQYSNKITCEMTCTDRQFIEIEFEGKISQAHVSGGMRIFNQSLKIDSVQFKPYKIRVLIPTDIDQVRVVFENYNILEGVVELKNIKLTLTDKIGVQRGTIRYIAHRGLSDLAPENTMPSFALASRLGYEFVETDVATTLDGEWVLLHDDRIDRTSTGSGKIADLTLSEVRTYDFGVKKGTEFLGTPIPTFEEFICFCATAGLHPYIELKKHGDIELIYKLVHVVLNYELDVTWISFSFEHLKKISELTNRGARCGFLSVLNETSIEQVKTLGERVFIDCQFHTATKDLVAVARKNKVSVECFTVDQLEDVRHLIKIG